ncbi:MAG: hypothetical protein WC928_01285 [Patescibacteria group bacterium]
MKKDNSGLWNASYGEVGATLKALQDQGIILSDLSLLRSDPILAKKVAEVIKSGRKKDPAIEAFAECLFDDNKNSRQIKSTWQRIYKKWFGLEKDFSDLQVPEHYDPRKHFAVIVAQGLTKNQIVAEMRLKFKVSLHKEDLDTSVNHNDRDAKNGDYIVLFNRNIEADEEFKDFPADQLKVMNHKGITLMERLLLEILYFDRTKKHLDISNRTLCTGSRYSDGYVPRVRWCSSGGGLGVGRCSPGFSDYGLRSREVVS